MPCSLTRYRILPSLTGAGHVGPAVERPGDVRLRDVAAPAGPNRHQRIHAARRDDEAAGDDRRRDDAVVAAVRRVEHVRAPELLAGGRIVARDVVAAGDDDLGALP